ncbi:MAG TPA: hypothetical protein DCX05_11550 [Prevotella sp.]|nr:hypothetical protein [Prevotella sp.]
MIVGAQQLTTACTSPVVRPEILTISPTYPIFPSNISYVFQQQEERVCHKSIIQARKSVRRNK